ncbi:MAG: glycine cleavage system aminomethyltransferase GcvT [Candidatus Rokuibacteriota bacterium]|nr:MAG: glycine cleavage system aminomethyltransferase GcvT [Candidatus Rokubacteria bacterium]
MDAPLKRTPLYEAHVKAGARLVPFGGWEMPVQYAGIIEEHRAVRSAVGLFDVSHMGEFEVDGPGALDALQSLTTNDVTALEVGQVQYSLLCYPNGTIVDDLTVYRLAGDRFMLTVNAANIDKDWAWVTTYTSLAEYQRKGVRWRNVSAETGLIAAQGPKAEELVGRLADQDVGKLGYYRFARGAVAGIAARLWTALLEAGHDDGAQPIGLGARDTLRLEMKYALYGNDIDDTTNALEAGLSWVVKPAKGEFIGRAALEKVRAEGVRRKLVGIEMVDKAVARHGYPVLKDGRRVGVVTSGSYGPSVDRYIAMAYVETALAAVDTPLAVEVRGQAKAARVVRTPFHPSRVKKG